jgi:sec-independent protein translocase protein TatC
MDSEDKQPFMSHLEELRKRLVYSAIAVGVGFAASYAFAEQTFRSIGGPPSGGDAGRGSSHLHQPSGDVFHLFKGVPFGGILLVAPIHFLPVMDVYRTRALSKGKEICDPFCGGFHHFVRGGVPFRLFCCFSLRVQIFHRVFQRICKSASFGKQYFSFAIKLLFAFGVVFELPVIIFFLAKMGMVTPQLLRKKRKYAILMTFVLAAILTPPDVVTQCMMAGPLIILYEIGILWPALPGNQKKRRKKRRMRRSRTHEINESGKMNQ